MAEAASGVIQSLDSLWFFSNTLSGSKQIPGLAAEKEKKPAESDSAINGEAELERSEKQSIFPECSVSEEIAEEKAEEERSSSGRRRRITRKVLGELDVGSNGGIRRDRQRRRLWVVFDGNMPPMSDGVAMKEHLKSWAYAVACSVK